jgi:hypothetical protein
LLTSLSKTIRSRATQVANLPFTTLYSLLEHKRMNEEDSKVQEKEDA